MTLEFPEIVAPAEAPAQAPAAAVAAELVDTAAVSDGKVLVNYSRTEAALADLRERFTGAQFDLTTTKGDKAARAARQELVTLRTGLEKKRLELKRPALEFGRKIDAEAERITGQIRALEKPIDAQIDADEKRRANEAAERKRLDDERQAKHAANIAKIAAMLTGAEDKSAERLAKGIEIVDGLLVTGFEEFQADAEATRTRVLLGLKALHQKAVDREAEEARRVEEQARLAREAAELAEERAQLARERAELEALRAAQVPAPVPPAPAPEPAPAPVAQQEVQEQPEAAGDAGAAAPAEHHVEAAPILAPQATAAVLSTAASSVPDARPPLTTGAVSDRLGFIVAAGFVERLGITPAPRPEGSKSGTFWHAADFPRICDALVAHINSVRGAA